MAREFTMGARINLNAGNYSNGMSDAIRSTHKFSEEIVDLDRSMGRYYDSSGRLREANGRFAASAGTATNQIQQQESGLQRLGNTANGLIGIFAALGGAMALRGAYDWLVGANADMEQYQNTLTVVLGSQKEALQTLKWAEKFAASTPFEIPQIVEATTRLSAYGMKAKDVLGITGDMASVMGKDLMQAVEAVADAQTGELERLKEFGITKKMLEEQAKLMGKNPVNKKGQITDQEAFNAALFALMEKRFKGGMEMQAKTFKGMLSNVSDYVGTVGRELGKPLFDNMKEDLQGLLTSLNELKESGKLDAWIKNIQNGFSTAGKVVGAVVAPFKALFDMMAGSGDQSYFVKLFGVEGASNFNNMLWDIVDTAKAFGSFAGSAFSTAGAAISKVGGLLKSVATYFLVNYPKFKPYIIGIATAFLTYFTYLKLVNTWTKIVGAAQLAFNTIMAMNPVILVVLAIGLLIGYLIHLAGGWDVVRQKLAVLWQYMITAWSSMKAWLVPFLIGLVQNILLWFNNIWLGIKPLLVTIWTGIVNIFNSLRTFWNQWGSLITKIFAVLWEVAKSIFMSAVSILWAIVKGAFDYICNIISGIFKIISGIIQVGWSVISGLFSIGLDLLSGNWKGAWDGMLDMLSGVWEGLKTFFSGLKDLFFDSGVAILNTLAEGITSAVMAPVNAVKAALKKVREFLPFSDAHKGPLSNLTLNGSKIVTTMAEGIYKQKGALASAMDNVLMKTPGASIPVGSVNPAGSTAGKSSGSGNKSIVIEKLIEKIEIIGAEGKNAKQLVDEIINILYERLSNADEIISAAGLGALLDD